MIEIPWVGLLSFAILLGLIGWATEFRYRRARVERDAALKLAEDAARVTKAASDLRELAEAEAETEKKARLQQFHLIEDTIQERDGIWQMYREAAVGAGNLQDLLLTELERWHRWGLAMGEKHGFECLELSEKTQKALGVYRKRHGDEANAKKGALEAKSRIKGDIAARMGRPGSG